MDFEDSPQEAAFRAKVRAWLKDHAPSFTPSAGASDQEIAKLLRAWQAKKFDAGFEGFGLPREYGGQPGTALETVIFKSEELAYPIAQLPMPYLTIGVGNAVPVMMQHARPEVAHRLIRPTLRGDLIWCQLFSEPGAGSDVAGIRTRAVRDGDEWIVNGQKVWSSGAHVSDWALLLVRTDPTVPKHKGLTYLLLDMKSPGVEVRPLKQITGRSEFNEVFLTDVRVPDLYRAGEPGDGWKVVITTLMNERLGPLTGSAASFGGIILEPLLRLARRVPGESGGRALDDPSVRAKLADYHVAVTGLKHLSSRLTTALSRGELPGPEAGIGKIILTRWLQEMAAFGVDLAGPAGALSTSPDGLAEVLHDAFLGSVGYRQGGGTEDINKSVIAERILGLPPDPRVDKDVPFDRMPASV